MSRTEPLDEEAFAAIERAIGYSFKDRALLLQAFTHSSLFAAKGEADNERLEFLGDAVLELVVTEMLIKRSREDEGKLTELRKQYVSQSALEKAEARLSLMQYLRYAGGENNIGGKTRSNLFEAVTGAIYLDGGLAAAKRFLLTNLVEIDTENYKTLLQEIVQEIEHAPPRYQTEQDGEEYRATVFALGKKAVGRGASKKAAETEAAKKLYLEWNTHSRNAIKGDK